MKTENRVFVLETGRIELCTFSMPLELASYVLKLEQCNEDIFMAVLDNYEDFQDMVEDFIREARDGRGSHQEFETVVELIEYCKECDWDASCIQTIDKQNKI